MSHEGKKIHKLGRFVVCLVVIWGNMPGKNKMKHKTAIAIGISYMGYNWDIPNHLQ